MQEYRISLSGQAFTVLATDEYGVQDLNAGGSPCRTATDLLELIEELDTRLDLSVDTVDRLTEEARALRTAEELMIQLKKSVGQQIAAPGDDVEVGSHVTLEELENSYLSEREYFRGVISSFIDLGLNELRIDKFRDPIEGPRYGLTIREAENVSQEDPGLLLVCIPGG